MNYITHANYSEENRDWDPELGRRDECSPWKDNNLDERYEAEYQQSAGNIASKTIIHLLGILGQERAEEEESAATSCLRIINSI